MLDVGVTTRKCFGERTIAGFDQHRHWGRPGLGPCQTCGTKDVARAAGSVDSAIRGGGKTR
ncbi:hypothetical protein ZHAS_00003988 [Anopheles sinensis]|uniref:Uncharacterized protein n=1 Tax=Anopheles sinensis TaxID=74873 RepID=A0A084VFT0_ANOSI|nr:hypothetical protein ZHAS_00003988 [Anopheles sinensis]